MLYTCTRYKYPHFDYLKSCPIIRVSIFGLTMRFSAAVFVAYLAVGVESFSTTPFRVAPSVSRPKTFSVHQHARGSPTRLFDASAAAVAPGESDTSGGTATISNEIFNLVKGIVGAGVLSLPAGTSLSVKSMRTRLLESLLGRCVVAHAQSSQVSPRLAMLHRR